MGDSVLPALRIPLLAALVATAIPTPALAQNECAVVSTFLGRWDRVGVSCDTTSSQNPRAAAVMSAALQGCPLLAGDRVAVVYENNDPARRPEITNVATRGETGASGGDWCTRGLPAGPYLGPCFVEESPPVAQRADTAGATSMRRSVATWVRDTNDGRRSMAGTNCSPLTLSPGVYRVYIEENIKRSTRVPGPTYYADRRTIEDTEWETNRYEGGIFIDGSIAPTDSVTDLTPFVRGWSDRAQTSSTTPSDSSPTNVEVRASRLSMTGLRTIRTNALSMAGLRVMRTRSLSITGLRTQRVQPLTMVGVRWLRVSRIAMTGLRQVRTQALVMTGYGRP